MATFTSMRPPACSSPCRIHPRTRTSVIIHLRFLSLPSRGRRLLVIGSSASPSPLLEETPDGLAGSSLNNGPKPEEASGELQEVQLRPGRPNSRPPGGAEAEISNGFIKELVKSPEMESLAYDYYQKARAQPGFLPDKQTLRPIIRYLLKSRQWDAIAALSEDFRTFGVLPDRGSCEGLIRGCIRGRKFRLAESLLGTFHQRQGSAAAWAFCSVMRGYNKLHMYSSTLRVHEQMQTAGVLPNAQCYFWVMDANRKLGNTEKVLTLFREFESRKMRSPPELSSRVYSTLCDALGRSGRAFEALRYFREMTQKGISPDAASYASLINTFAGVKEAEIAEDLFNEGREKGLVKDPAVFLRLVLMYVEVGALGKTLEVVRAMKELGLGVSDCVFCAVINGHAKKGGLRAAVRAYEEMITLGCEPGQVSYASAIGVFCRLGLYPKAEALFQEMLAKGFDRCVVAYSNMMSMYGKSGRTREATKLLAKMKEKGCEPNVWVYNALIDMHGRAMDLRQVGKLWREMKRRKVAPDRVSYTSAIGAYSRAREFAECMRLYEEFRMGGGQMDRAVAGIMVGAFSKNGRVDEMVKLLQDAKAEGVELDERLYMSAVNALRDAGLQAQIRWLQESFGRRFHPNAE